MNHETAHYEKALNDQLRCTGNVKRRLLRHFRDSLEAFLEDHPSPTADDLRNAFGPPEVMANILMESVSQGDRMKYWRYQKMKRAVIVILTVLFMIYVGFILFWKQKPITSTNEIIIDPVTITTAGN